MFDRRGVIRRKVPWGWARTKMLRRLWMALLGEDRNEDGISECVI